MKKTTNFNISVPELGDRPDITQVSNAIQDLEDALAGTVEVLKATIEGTKITLVSGSRTTARTRYYEGMAIRFVSPATIQPNALKTASVDGLRDQVISIPYFVSSGDIVDIVFSGDKFNGVLVGVPKSNEINSDDTNKVATPKAVNSLRKKLESSDNAIWGGEDGGGKIEDASVVKVPGKRYVGADGKAYINKPGRGTADIGAEANINNSQNYNKCNVVDNSKATSDLIDIGYFSSNDTSKFRVSINNVNQSISSADVSGRYFRIKDQFLVFGSFTIRLNSEFNIPNDDVFYINLRKDVIPTIKSYATRDCFGAATYQCQNAFDSALIGLAVQPGNQDDFVFSSGEYLGTGDVNTTIIQRAKFITVYFSICQ